VVIELPLAGAHGYCESEIGLKRGHDPRQVALSLDTWCAHLSAAKMAVAAWSKQGRSRDGAEISRAEAEEWRG